LPYVECYGVVSLADPVLYSLTSLYAKAAFQAVDTVAGLKNYAL
jgi:hypothetical protein